MSKLSEIYCEGWCKEGGGKGSFDDCTGCQVYPLEAEITRLRAERAAADDKFYEALGWMHAHCCATLDRGEDPRNLEMGEILCHAEQDFAEAQEE